MSNKMRTAAGPSFEGAAAARRETIGQRQDRRRKAPSGKPARASGTARPDSPRRGPIAPRPAVPRPVFPELLAPAGSAEAYFAAAEAGADAVYLGLDRFNARERAENFGVADLCRLLPHARRHGIRLYLAMNTLLTETDLPDAIALLHQVAPLLPDAVIVQDLGLLRIVRDVFPELPVHVSTQAGCASLEAAEGFARLGAERVILERHLRLDEVRQIASRAPLGVEIFVHGSLCYSFSGKCLFSSYLGGRSGNRGACVQPCRRLYGHAGGEGAIFSTRDLGLMERLPDLVPLGIAAFKIEGRMRSAEYVGGVVAAYRAALDLIRAGRPGEAVAEGTKRLADVIGREETPGILGGARPDEVVAGGETGGVGERLGTIREIRDGWALLGEDGEEAAAPRRGDRLRVQFRADGSGKGFTVLEMRTGPAGLAVRVPFPVSPGDFLFRVGGGGRAGITRRAKREMESLPSRGASFRIVAGEGVVRVEASYGRIAREYRVRVAGDLPAGGGGIPADAAERLGKAYRSDLPLGEIGVEFRGRGVPWRDIEGIFLRAARAFDKEFYLAGKELRLAVMPTLRVAGSRPAGPSTLFFVGCLPDRLDLLPRSPEIVPVVEFTKALARDPDRRDRAARGRPVYFRLPAPLLPADAVLYRRAVGEAVRRGHRRWVVSDIGHFRLFGGPAFRRDVTLVSDQSLYALNMGALSVLSRLGASRMILPAEAPLSALAAVGKYLHGLGIACVYGAVPLMVSRLLPPPGVRGAVTSPRGERFEVEADERGSVLRPTVPFSASGSLGELRAAGIRDFYADLRGADGPETEEVLAALRADGPIPGTSAFNLFRENF